MRGVGSTGARFAAGVIVLVAVFAAAFALARATRSGRGRAASVRVTSGVPVGVEHSRAGALAAADNYVAVGITDSLDEASLETFGNTVVAPSERRSLIDANARLAQQGPPPGTNVIGTLVAHRLDSYTGPDARVSVWDVGDYWGAELEPTQYWALADLSLRWTGARWWVVSLDERLPGPVPALVAVGATGSPSWSQALAGMDAPYYGAG
jgi:hypothetical protein